MLGRSYPQDTLSPDAKEFFSTYEPRYSSSIRSPEQRGHDRKLLEILRYRRRGMQIEERCLRPSVSRNLVDIHCLRRGTW